MKIHVWSSHVENFNYIGAIKNLGPCSSKGFRKILTDTDRHSVEEGFSVKIPDGEKHFKVDPPPSCSIITLSVNPSEIRFHRNLTQALAKVSNDIIFR